MDKTKKRETKAEKSAESTYSVSTPIEELLIKAMERDDDSLETGRYIITYKLGMTESGIKELKSNSFKTADSRDFKDQHVSFEECGDADAVVFSEIGCALIGGEAFQSHSMSIQSSYPSESPMEYIEPEYFVFSDSNEYLRGFASAVNTIVNDLKVESSLMDFEKEVEAELANITWGLSRCNVHQSMRSGKGIKIAILDTGMDRHHKDFKGRDMIPKSFVGQPVQDLKGHGTHCIGTACGPNNPTGTKNRYGIAFDSEIFVGKVLTNSGNGSSAGVLAGINWAIANRCEVISLSLGSPSPPQIAYTSAGAAALRNGLLIIAAAGNDFRSTGSPANSPTIMSVASLDPNLRPSSFSNFGKIEIAAPGRNVFSSWRRPKNYNTISGTSMATPHVAGCAALWAEADSSLRGINLWRKLESSARSLPQPKFRVGSGLVQAPN